MFIHNLEIKNFRGIKEANITFPEESRIVCIVGPGDSTKSTILKAIDSVFSDTWNLNICDNDFYNCDINTPIQIRATFSEIPSKLITEDKYGLYLRCYGVEYDNTSNDEPKDGEPECLTIQLTIDETLEPKWEIICNRLEPKIISVNDRRKLQCSAIGDNCSKDMLWTKTSVLQKYTDSKETLANEHTRALREISKTTDFSKLDTISNTIVDIGKKYGVDFNGTIKNRLLVQNNAIYSTVGLYDDDTPLMQRGNGSQKLLSIGLNIEASTDNVVLLIDEIEIGLEPYRLKSLISTLRENKNKGQVIMSTHSPIAVAECDIHELLILRNKDGRTVSLPVVQNDTKLDTKMQAHIRRNPEAFLSKSIIVCEGKTEIGIIRAIDKYIEKIFNTRIAYKGIGYALGGGSEVCDFANVLVNLGYSICVFMDSDKAEEEPKKETLRTEGAKVIDWNPKDSIEEGIFGDVDNKIASSLINIVIKDGKDPKSIYDSFKSKGIKSHLDSNNIIIDEIDKNKLKKIGTIAKNKEKAWYKRIDLGEDIGDIIIENLDVIDKESRLFYVINELISWVNNND